MLPLSTYSKQKVRHRLFSNFPFIFRKVKAYSDWQRHNAPINQSVHDGGNNVLSDDPLRRIVVVSHDAQAHGAQFLALGYGQDA